VNCFILSPKLQYFAANFSKKKNIYKIITLVQDNAFPVQCFGISKNHKKTDLVKFKTFALKLIGRKCWVIAVHLKSSPSFRFHFFANDVGAKAAFRGKNLGQKLLFFGWVRSLEIVAHAIF
jgi:hypothetical protein